MTANAKSASKSSMIPKSSQHQEVSKNRAPECAARPTPPSIFSALCAKYFSLTLRGLAIKSRPADVHAPHLPPTTTVILPEMPEVLPQQQQCPRGPANDLHRAAIDGSIQRTVALLSRGSLDINQGAPDGVTALMLGAAQGHVSIVRILLNKGADVSSVTDIGSTALHFAAENGHLAVTMLLVEMGADLDAMCSSGPTPLYLAAEQGHEEVVAALIDAGVNCNTRLLDGDTPLSAAAASGHWKAVRVLLHRPSLWNWPYAQVTRRWCAS